MWKTKKHQFKNTYSFALIASLISSSAMMFVPVALAAGAQGETAVSKGIPPLEQRFFSRQYANDPPEKRLERLELLVFGSTQDGSSDERFARLKKTIGERAKASEAQSVPGPASKPGVAKKIEMSAQYPVLNTLEWRALKKTYASETLDQRLGRLEKKLFGQDNPAMAYADRVERLQRTLAVGSVAQQPEAIVGPAPKARPRSRSNDIYGFSSPPVIGDGSGGRAFGGGFGGGFSGGFDEDGLLDGMGLPSAFTQMFKQMNQQMAELGRLGPGQWTFDNASGMWVEQNSGRRMKPGSAAVPGMPLMPGMPGQPGRLGTLPGLPVKPFKTPMINPRKSTPFQFQTPQDDSKLPPYADPNSI